MENDIDALMSLAGEFLENLFDGFVLIAITDKQDEEDTCAISMISFHDPDLHCHVCMCMHHINGVKAQISEETLRSLLENKRGCDN